MKSAELKMTGTALISVAIRGVKSAELKMIEAPDQFDFYPEFDLLNLKPQINLTSIQSLTY